MSFIAAAQRDFHYGADRCCEGAGLPSYARGARRPNLGPSGVRSWGGCPTLVLEDAHPYAWIIPDLKWFGQRLSHIPASRESGTFKRSALSQRTLSPARPELSFASGFSLEPVVPGR
jgi:hypothetical protein